MAYPIPTLKEIHDDVTADLRSRLSTLGAILRRSLVGAVAIVVAGAVNGLYGFLGWIAKQAIPDTATGTRLERWAAIWDVTRLPATKAEGTISVTGAGAAAIPAGTLGQTGTGVQFESPNASALVVGAANVTVRAVLPGTAGNLPAGAALSLVSPVADVVAAASAAAAFAGGGAEETDGALRGRFLARLRMPPAIGTDADYVRWARETGSWVTDAWCFRLGANPGSDPARAATLGTVLVFFMVGTNRAIAAEGTVRVSANAAAAIPEGTVWSAASGVKVKSTEAGAVPANGHDDIPVVAVRAGEAGNLAAAVALTLDEAIAGVTGTVTTAAMTGGADMGIPTAAQVALVDAYVQARCPNTADVTVAAPSPAPLDLTIDALSPDTPAVRAAIEAEIADLVVRDAAPGGRLPVSRIREAISSAEGETDHSLTAPAGKEWPAGSGNAPAVTHAYDEIAVMGEITWT